ALVTRAVVLPGDLPEEPVDLVISGITLLAAVSATRVLAEGSRPVIAMRARRVVPPGRTVRGDIAARVVAADRARWKLDEDRKAAVRERDRLYAVVLEADMSRRTRRVDPVARIGDGLAAAQLVREQLEKADAEILTLDEALARNDRERQALALERAQAEPDHLEAAASRPALEFVLRIARSSEAMSTLALVYVIDAARWWPAYTARLSRGGTRVSWALDALVAQDSGESWDGVNLSLSTAGLARDARLPELPSLRLGRAQPSTKRGFRPPPAGLDELFAGYDRVRQALMPPVHAGGAGTGMVPMGGRAHHIEDARARLEEAAGEESGGLEEDTDAFEAFAALAPPPIQAPGGYLPPPAAAAAPLTRAAMSMAPPQSVSASRGAMMPSAKKSMAFGGALLDQLAGGVRQEPAPTAFDEAAQPALPDAEWLDFDTLTLGSENDARVRGRLARGGDAGDPAARQRAVHAIETVAPPRDAVDPDASRGHFDHRYDATAPCDVASDARIHRVTLARVEGDAEMTFRTVPREHDAVFREAVLRNPFETPLLTGPVDVFFDDALLTTSRIAFVDRGGMLRLGLGVEERLRVARNARVDEGAAGLLGGSTAVDHAVSIEIASSLGRAVRVDVIDRVPVTDDKEIDVSLTSAQPRPDTYDQADIGEPVRGGLRFRVDVPAGGKARVEFAYRVKLPGKNEVIGGNRRE
ncbi:MAG: DUF4139 domain-containing protein, partial [Deltaproteobacteria bacterium]